MLLAAVLAAIDVRTDASGVYEFGFHVGQASLIALGLIWLPSLLKVFALVGGSIKAVGIEASVQGVLTRADAIDISVNARQVTSASDEEERRVAAQELEQVINRLVIPTVENASISEASLFQLARDYERLRRDHGPGSRRTSAMTRIVNESRVRASLAPEAALQQAGMWLQSNRPGDRIVGLGLTQETGDPTEFERVLGLVSGSESAFEMYHALLALQEMSVGLDEVQKRQAIEVLEHEATDPRPVEVNADPGLPTLLARTVGILSGDE